MAVVRYYFDNCDRRKCVEILLSRWTRENCYAYFRVNVTMVAMESQKATVLPVINALTICSNGDEYNQK